MVKRLTALAASQLLLVAVALLWSGMARGAEVNCTIKYLSAEHVYLDTGSVGGLETGLKGQVIRDGAAIGEIEIVFVAERSASCTIISQVQDFVAGDTVLFEIDEAEPETITEPAPAPRVRTRVSGSGSSSRRPAGGIRWRGSLALQWDHGEEANDRKLTTDMFRLPFRVRADDVWNGFAFHARGSLRRIERDGFSASTPTGEWRNRIQEVALVREDRELDWHVALGRISTRATATAGPFDGLALSRRVTANSRVGVFGGFAPEWGDLGFGTDDHLLGANYHLSRRGDDGRMLDLLLSGIGRYRSGEISREYVTMTTSWRGTQGLSLLQAAEVDINRGWRSDAGAKSVVLSSIALTGRYRFNAAATVNLGFDNREPVRTWESRSLPDSLFEDAGRKGWRAGVNLKPLKRLSIYASGSLRTDDRTGDNVTSWQVRAYAPGLVANRVSVFASLRGFDGPWLSGFAPSAGASKAFRSGLSLRLEGGYYDYTGAIDNSSRSNSWLALGAEKDLTSRLSLSAEYRNDWGDDIEGRRWFLELRHRF